MNRLSLHITASSQPNGAEMVFNVPDMRTALIVADINMEAGVAEVRNETGRIASVRRVKGQRLPLWELS